MRAEVPLADDAELLVEVNFDGLVGPTHNFAGLSFGNEASANNEGAISDPAAAALEGIAKMRALHTLGVPQAVLPPHPRPSLKTLRRLGFAGSDEKLLAEVALREPLLLRLVSSASSMWAANAATVAPATDTADGRLNLVPANLRAMFHRSIEALTTRDVLRAIFSDGDRFAVHDPLPGGEHFGDEGAANHTRLETEEGIVHLFAWGRSAWDTSLPLPKRYPARQTREASEAVARLLGVSPAQTLFTQQHPDGIDGGAFHTDVLAVGHRHLFIHHELAFADGDEVTKNLTRRLGDGLAVFRASNEELPLEDAVRAYPFNSQIVTLPNGALMLVSPIESRDNPRARAFLERVQNEGGVSRIEYLDVRQSMRNGGGPACLRQRVPLLKEDISAIEARVMIDLSLVEELEDWVRANYRDRLVVDDLRDPLLHRETMRALDELTQILRLGPVYEFQRTP